MDMPVAKWQVGAGSLIDLQDYVLRATESDANELYTL